MVVAAAVELVVVVVVVVVVVGGCGVGNHRRHNGQVQMQLVIHFLLAAIKFW